MPDSVVNKKLFSYIKKTRYFNLLKCIKIVKNLPGLVQLCLQALHSKLALYCALSPILDSSSSCVISRIWGCRTKTLVIQSTASEFTVQILKSNKPVKLGIDINCKSFSYRSHGITSSFLAELKCSSNNCCLIMGQLSTFSSLEQDMTS